MAPTGAAHRKEIFMERVTIELHPEGADVRIDDEKLYAAIKGCVKTFDALGNLGQLIDRFHISFVACRTDKTLFGPSIAVYFRDPLGGSCSYDTGMFFTRHIADCYVSAENITQHLMEHLPKLIHERVAEAHKKLPAIISLFKSLTP